MLAFHETIVKIGETSGVWALVLRRAVEGAFKGEVNIARLVKIYGADPEGNRRYSPAE